MQNKKRRDIKIEQTEIGVKVAREIVIAMNRILKKYGFEECPYSNAEGIFIYVQESINSERFGSMLFGNINKVFALAMSKMCVDDAIESGKAIGAF
jgi:hypothetical protein